MANRGFRADPIPSGFRIVSDEPEGVTVPTGFRIIDPAEEPYLDSKDDWQGMAPAGGIGSKVLEERKAKQTPSTVKAVQGGYEEKRDEAPLLPKLTEAQQNANVAEEQREQKRKRESEPKYQGFGKALLAGIDDLQMLTYSAGEAVGEVTGNEMVADWGERGRIRNTEEGADQGQRGKFADINSVGDAFGWAGQTIGNLVPVVIPSMVAGAAGAAAAPAGAVAATVGGALGAFVPSLAFGVGEVQAGMKEKDPSKEADGWVFAGGTAIAALDSVLPGAIGGKLVKAFGREAAEEIALRTLVRPSMVKGGLKAAGKGALVEGATESLQEAIGEVTASLAAEQKVNWDALPGQMLEAGAAGALMGSVMSGPAGAAEARQGQRGFDAKQGQGIPTTGKAPEPGRNYKMADAIFELGMDPAEAAQRYGTPEEKALNSDPERVEAMRRGAAKITQEDADSPLDTSLIAEGLGRVDMDLANAGEDDVLRQYGMPTAGADVVVRRGPDGVAETGKMLGSFTVEDQSGAKHGVRVQMNDGSMYEELIDDIQRGGQSIQRAEDYLATPVVKTEPVSDSVAEATAQPNPNIVPVRQPESAAPARDVLKGKIRTVESGGNDSAKNPLSSASGRYQFIDSTWTALGGDPAKKNDPAEQERLMDKLVDQNEAALAKAGLEASAGNLYLAHFLGSGGAVNALRDPDGKVSEAVQKANPFAKGWTNAQLAAWADKKMGGTGVVAEASSSPELTDWLSKLDSDSDDLAFTDVKAATLEAPEMPEGDGKSYTEKVREADIEAAKIDDGGRTQAYDPNENEPSDADWDAIEAGESPELLEAAGFPSDMTREEFAFAQSRRDLSADEAIELYRAKRDPNTIELTPQGQQRTEVSPQFALSKQEALKSKMTLKRVTGDKIDNDWVRFSDKSGTLGIPRAEMPQIKGEHRGAMVNFLNADGIKHSDEVIDPSALKPTQAEFSPTKAASWDKGNVKLEERKLLVSSDNYILDGQHQWVKALERGVKVGILRLDAPIRELIPAVRRFPSSTTSEGADLAKVAAVNVIDGDDRKASLEPPAGIQAVGGDEPSLPQSGQSGVSQLRGEGTAGASEVEARLPDVLSGRGAAPDASTYAGEEGQQPGLRTGERLLGDAAGAESQLQPEQAADLRRSDAMPDGVVGRDGNLSRDPVLSAQAGLPARGSAVQGASQGRSVLSGGAVEGNIADAILETDPALDWDSSERHERDAVLRAIKMTKQEDRRNTVDKPFAELPPRLREMVESHLRKGYAKKAEAADAPSPVKQLPPRADLKPRTNADYQEQGRQAAVRGFSPSENPYYASSTANEQWTKGYTGASKPTKQEMLKAAQKSGKLEIVDMRNPVEAPEKSAVVVEAQADTILEEAEQHQAALAKFGAQFESFSNPGLKSKERIVEKVLSDDYASARDLKDIVRGGFFVSTVEEADKVFAAVTAQFPNTRDKGWQALDDGGYFDRKVIVTFPGGIMGEIQIVPAEVWAFKKEGKPIKGDALYNQFRVLEPGPRKEELRQAMFDGYLKAVAGGDFKSLASSVISASGNSLVKAAWDKVLPSLEMSPGTPRQEPSRQSSANSLPPRSPSTTGRSSTSRNLSDASIDPDIEAKALSDKQWGASNKLVTRDRAEELRKRFSAGLNQVNSGVNPEMMAIAAELAVFHIEAGARKFADFASVMLADFGAKARPYLRGAYISARDIMDSNGAPVADMDGAEKLDAILADLDRNATGSIDVSTEDTADASTPAQDEARTDDRDGDARDGAEDAPRADGERSTPDSVEPESDGGAGNLQSDVRDGAGDGAAISDERDGADLGADAGTDGSSGSGNRAGRGVRAKRSDRGTNHLAAPGGLKRVGGWKATAERNLDIVELVNRLEAEGRTATPAEQELLSKFVGWGASELRNGLFGNVGRDYRTNQRELRTHSWGSKTEWNPLIERAQKVLTGEALDQALQSVQYAHYTGEEVVRAIWDGVQRLGFNGGKILEPGMGTGNFLIAAPESVAKASSYTGIELESFTAKVAKHLLPQENVIHGDFVKQAFPSGFFDMAIGNPPFADIAVTNDPAFKKYRFRLHDYFFAKSIDKVRPGGLLAFVTSKGTMDKNDRKAREYIAERADLIGAIRLPQTAFKENAGTEVVTDILFFQRRAPGQAPGGEAWLGLEPLKLKDSKGGTQKYLINEYFKAHPEMVLGKHAMTGSMYGPDEYTVEPYTSKKIEAQLAEAMNQLPEGTYTDAPRKAAEEAKAKTFERDFAPASSKEGGLYEKDGKLLVRDQGSGLPIDAFGKFSDSDKAWLKGYVKIRDALKEAQKAQLEDAPDWEAKLDTLRKLYKAFTKKHGPVSDFTKYERRTTDDDGEEKVVSYKRFRWQRLMDLDVESVLVGQLDKITDEDEITEGPFLKGRTLNKPSRPQIESAQDALAVTLDEVGRLDLDYIAKLLGKSREDVVAALDSDVFEGPDGIWLTADEYLSGDVVTKLEEARAAAAADSKFERNVQALIEVQPKPLSPDQITVKLGAGWVPADVVNAFVSEELGLRDPGITYNSAGASWNVNTKGMRYMRSNLTDFGTPDRSPAELVDALLNNRSIKITRTEKVDGSTKTYTDEKATAAANEAAKKIVDKWQAWLWTDAQRANELAEIYNRKFNNLAPRRFNGDHLTLPGLSAHFKPHPHVKRAVWRIIQTGNTYLAHAVGAGKTAEQIISGMEQRRLGLIKKPMYVVPNHMLEQFGREFLELYPAANIMVADEKAFHTGNRRRFLAQAALNDPDAIILTHSSFGKIDTSIETKRAVLDDMIMELEDALEEAKQDAKNGGARHTVKDIEKRIEQLTKRFEGKQIQGKDKALSFEEMGVDFVYVDEAHEFRKLDFATNRNAKGITAAGSQKALDLFIKTRWLNKQNPGRAISLASGTPITNTMAEIYTVMRFMDYEGLERDGIQSFDAWANMFGEVAAGYEQNAAGGYEIVERFAKFVNVPELMKRVRSFMDVLTSEQLGSLVKRPAVKGRVPENVVATPSPQLERYMRETLDTRLKKSREWKPSPDQPGNPDPVINIITDARLASIDMRFVQSMKDDPHSKLNKMLDKIVEKHKEFGNTAYVDPATGQKDLTKGGVQIVFSAVGFGEEAMKNRGFDVRGWIEAKLTAGGIRKSQIAWMSDANSHAKKAALQKDVRAGKVRVLIGSPKNMGTGMNVQRRLKVLHFLAPPWYPSDVEQPHGRIVRQGNLHDEVELYWYATKGTYDSTQWGMVSRKQKFIEQAMTGDDSVRSLEDISEASQYEMAAALAAGDERIIKVAGLTGDIERLKRLKGAHSDQQRQLAGDKNWIVTNEPKQAAKIAALEKALEAKGVGLEPFSLTIGKQSFDKPGEAGEAMLGRITAKLEEATTISREELGKLYGKFPVEIAPAGRTGAAFDLTVEVGGLKMDVLESRQSVEDINPAGLLTRIQNKVQQLPSALSEAKQSKAQRERELAAIEKRLGAPFEFEAELREKVAEREQLQADIAAETKAKDEAKDKPNEPAPDVRDSVSDDARDFASGLTEEQQAAIAKEVAAQLEKLIPGNRVAIELRNGVSADGKLFNGQYFQRVISVAYDASNGVSWTLGHESLHAMKAMGLFTKSEWNLLKAAAWTNKGDAHRDAIRKRWAHYADRQPDPKLLEEMWIEEAIAEHFGEFAGLRKDMDGSFVGRMLKRLINLIAVVSRAIHKVRGYEKGVEAVDAIKLMQRMARGEIGSRPDGFGMEPTDVPSRRVFGKKADNDIRASVSGTISPASPDFGGSTEQRWKEAAKGIGDGPGIIEKAKGWWADFTAGFSRHWRDLPNEPRFADLQQQLRKLEAAPEAALESTVRHLRTLVGKLNKEEMDLLARKVVLDDLMWEAGADHKLPFGFTPATLRMARVNIDGIVATNPKVLAAVRARKLANRRLADEMVQAGVLTPEQVQNPAYYRHMVLQFARTEAKMAKSGNVKSPYWAKRMGSELDINANLLEAEFDWMIKAQVDIATAKTIEWIKASNHNIREDLRKQAKGENKAKIDAIIAGDPAAKEMDGKFRANIARGLKLVKDELDAGSLVPPPNLTGAANALATGSNDASVFPLLSWIMDESKPGSMGAAMVLSATGRRKAWEKAQLGREYIDPEDIKGLVAHYKPEGFTTWQPREGQHLFTARTVSEHVLDMFVSKLATGSKYPGVSEEELTAALGTVKQQLVVGGDRYTLVIPDELSATLNEYGDRRMAGMVAQVFGELQGAWKRWTLINPRRFLKYNLNNMSGDLDAIIAGNPGTLRYVGQSAKEIAAVWRSKAPESAAYKEAVERGVFTSGLSAQEIPDINSLSGLRHLTAEKSMRPDKLVWQAAANVWNALQGATNYREAVFRYAAYLDYKAKIDAGMPQLKIGYGASVPAMVEAVPDPADRAALLARDLIGDYGAISVAGGWLRRYLIPFWSWTEINTKRYWRLTANAFRTSNARGLATGGLLGAGIAARTSAVLFIRMAVVYGAIHLWNNILFDDEEEELTEQQRRQLHLVLGRNADGEVRTLRFQGALSDVFGMFGFPDAVAGIRAWERGQGTIGQAVRDTLKAPVNRIGTSTTPIFTTPIEQALDQELWPDMFSPRQIKDNARHLFSTFTLEHEYDAVAGNPSRGYVRSWIEGIVYRRDPGEMAYDEARSIAYDYLEDVKGQQSSRGGSKRSDALRDYKMAMRYGDVEAANDALDRYEEFGGTGKGLKSSIRNLHPLGPISKKDRPEFVGSLTEEQLETFRDAEVWYEEVYLGKEPEPTAIAAE